MCANKQWIRQCCRSSNSKSAKKSFPEESSWTQPADIGHQGKSYQGGINCSIGVDSTSATTTTLLSLAFVLLDWGLVVTNALEIRKNPSLRDCSLKATKGRFNALILPYRDLSHKQIQPINEFTRPPLLRNSPTQQKGVRHHLENWRSDQ